MKRTTRVVVVGLLVIGAFSVTGCSISIGAMGEGSSAAPVSSAGPSMISPVSPSATSVGSTYLALVGPVNTATFALDTAVYGPTADLTPESLRAIIAASASSIRTFDDRLRSTTWPRTAVPDITTLASTNDVLVEVLGNFESELQSPTAADFNAVVQALQADTSGYANDREVATDAAGRVRADLGLPPPSASQVTLND
jgi:hypothetical protein